MDTNELLDGLAAGTLTRRDFTKALASVGLGIATLPVLSRRARAAQKVLYFGWAGYDDPGFAASYIEKYGDPPEYTFWATEDEAFQKMRMGGFVPDVMNPCTYEIVKWYEGGLLNELDVSRLEHLPDMFASLNNIEGSIIDGKRYYMPVDWGNSTVIYRTDLVNPEDGGDNLSWGILYDDKYKNRIAFFDWAPAVVEIAGLLLGYENIFSLTDEQLVEVRKIVEKQRDNLRFYWSDQSEIEQALASGELVAAYGWNDGFARLKEAGVPVALGVPKEGMFTWVCGLVMHSENKNEEASYDLINAFSSPEAGAFEIENWGFGHANMKAFDLVAPEKLVKLGLSTPSELIDAGIFFNALDPVIEEKYIRLLEEVKAGA